MDEQHKRCRLRLLGHGRCSIDVVSRALHRLAASGLLIGIGLAVSRTRQPRESFRERTVVITGGSRGFGFALARRFAAEGARLALLARTTGQLDEAIARLRADYDADAMAVSCDVRDPRSVRAAVAAIVARTGGIDVLVNNAGVIQVMPFEHVQLEDVADSLDTHVWGPMYLIGACLPYLRRARDGRIVNVASIGGRIAVPHLFPYAIGKFALVGLSESLHAELTRHGIAVTTVVPHLMRTGSHRNAVVRGQHAKEAVWFALGTASRLTAIDATRAASRVVEAVRNRRARITLGWQARLAEVADAVAPETTAALTAMVARLLPKATTGLDGDRARVSREIDLGTLARLFPTDAALDLNQQPAPDELRGAPGMLFAPSRSEEIADGRIDQPR